MKANNVSKTIEDYIASSPESVQPMLRELRNTIKAAAPDAVEKISYQMPAFSQNGILVYFAAHTNHIGFYPTSSGIKTFQKELSNYDISKGTVRFPLDKPLPMKLISQIVSFRVKENLQKPKKKL
jgi:uncharacterized protein YdhG (YjbR/CyaY superfamily)